MAPRRPCAAVVVSRSLDTARYLQLAAASRDGRPAALLAPADFPAANLDGCSLLVWQDALPDGEAAARAAVLRRRGRGGRLFSAGPRRCRTVQRSGLGRGGELPRRRAAFTFCAGTRTKARWPGARSASACRSGKPFFRAARSLPDKKTCWRRFEDGAALLARQNLGRGEVYFCASLPAGDWSSLADGPVLVPMLQRAAPGRRPPPPIGFHLTCGELSAADLAKTWVSRGFHGAEGHPFSGRRLSIGRPPHGRQSSAGRGRPGNRGLRRDQKLFGDLPLQMLQDRRVETGQLQGEIWRLFLFLMLLLLLARAC